MLFQLIWNKANIDKAYLQRGVSIPQQLIGSMARDAKRRDKEVLMGLSFSVGRDVQNTKLALDTTTWLAQGITPNALQKILIIPFLDVVDDTNKPSAISTTWRAQYNEDNR